MRKKLSIEPLEARWAMAYMEAFSATDGEQAFITAAERQYGAAAEVAIDVPPEALTTTQLEEHYTGFAGGHAYVESSGSVSGQLTATTTIHGLAGQAADGSIAPAVFLRLRESTTVLIVNANNDLTLTAGFTANVWKSSHFACCGTYINEEEFFEGVTGSITVLARGRDITVTVIARSYFFESNLLSVANPEGDVFDTLYADHGRATLEIFVSARQYSIEAYGRTRVFKDAVWGDEGARLEAHYAAYGELNLPMTRIRGAMEMNMASDGVRFLGSGHDPWGRTNEYQAAVDLAMQARRLPRGGSILAEATYSDEADTDSESFGRGRRDHRSRNPGQETAVAAGICGYCAGDQTLHEDFFDLAENWLLPPLLPLPPV